MIGRIVKNKPKLVIVDKIKGGIINKGTGAGGANTNYYGKKFEEKTNNYIRLLERGYIENSFTTNQKKVYERVKRPQDYFLSKEFDDKTIIFVLQNGLKKYLKNKYSIEIFRCPDEAYIIEYNTGKKIIKIIEKKEQNVSGSVETKLWASPSLKREYELVLGNEFEVEYCLCVNFYLQNLLLSNNNKYVILNKILVENKINILFGDDDNYFETLDGLCSV